MVVRSRTSARTRDAGLFADRATRIGRFSEVTAVLPAAGTSISSPAAFGQTGAVRADAGLGCFAAGAGAIFAAFTGTSGTGFADEGV
ncbi:hypothetical protein [Actinoplanes regularis]|uniref:Uncharacterized protein n=1 Tax=Actinoplanes regularis TaxID=52697 RepID=A0A238V250_9ACTN|nr:hypothetical protein [Actinoplanes regularis]SNR28221.1 hypothetical protein SAMN06264365_101521 [Actinoplanes regularis]